MRERQSFKRGSTRGGTAAAEEVQVGEYDPGDRVLITDGAFAGEKGVVVTGDELVRNEIEVALASSGRRVGIEVDHVEPTDGWRSRVQAGESVIVAQGDFRGERGVVVGDAGLIGQRILVRLDSGREIDTREAHVSLCRRG
jgi:transcription antitermination factor NusG